MRKMSGLKKRNKRLRFTYDDDVVLLREVVALNPIANPEKWEVVEQNLERIVAKKFAKRSLKQHLQLLLGVWMKKDAICKIRSGSEEPYSEKNILLQEISILCHESEIKNKNKKGSTSKEKTIAELGRAAWENIALAFANEDCGVDNNIEIDDVIISEHDYCGEVELNVQSPESLAFSSTEENMQGTSQIVEISNRPDARNINQKKDVDSPTATKRHISAPIWRRIDTNRTLKKDTLAYLNDKRDMDHKIRAKELELEERKIALEERKLHLQEEKHEIELLQTRQKIELVKERFKLELMERKTKNALLESQQKIIDNLLKKCRS